MNSALIIFTALTMTPFIVSGFDMTSCSNLKPSGSVAAQKPPAPFALTAASDLYESGVPLAVTLNVTSPSVTFLDFMLIAQCTTCSNTTVPVGTFTVTPSGSKTLSCYNPKDAVTASDFSSKTTLTFRWMPPSNFHQTVVMKASVVEETNVWYENIRSGVINPKPKPLAIAPRVVSTTMTPPTTKKTTMPTTTTTKPKCGSMSTAPTFVTLLMFVVTAIA